MQVHEHIKVALALFSAHILFKHNLMERKISVPVVREVAESFVLLPVSNLSQDGAQCMHCPYDRKIGPM